jgi:hypothetical protein
MPTRFPFWPRLKSWLSPREVPARRVRPGVERLEGRELPAGGCWITLQNVNNPSQTETRQYPSYEALHQELASEQNNGWLATGWIATNYDDTGCTPGGGGDTNGQNGGTFILHNVTAIRRQLLALAARMSGNPNNFYPDLWARRRAWVKQVRAATSARTLAHMLRLFENALRPEALSPQWQSMRADWVAQVRQARTAHQVGELFQQLSSNVRQ